MLSFESCLLNTVDDSDDDLSEFLLSLASLRANLGGSWVLDFHHSGIAPAGNPLLAFISRLLRYSEDSGSILLPKPQVVEK